MTILAQPKRGEPSILKRLPALCLNLALIDYSSSATGKLPPFEENICEQIPGNNAVFRKQLTGIISRFQFFQTGFIQFDSLPPRREENAHRGARLAREMRKLTSMTWDYKCAR